MRLTHHPGALLAGALQRTLLASIDSAVIVGLCVAADCVWTGPHHGPIVSGRGYARSIGILTGPQQ